jgi:hypothetical protein
METLPLGGAAIPQTMTPIDGSSKANFSEFLFHALR